MPVIKSFILEAAIGALVASSSPVADRNVQPSKQEQSAAGAAGHIEPPLMFDGVELPRLTETAYAFECEKGRTRIAYAQTRKDPDEAERLRDALSVTLRDLSISTIAIADADREAIRKHFATYAWIEQVEVRCYGKQVQITVRGAPLEPWIAYFEKNLKKRPQPFPSSIRLRNGEPVQID
jgi:hypothetical protein